LAAALIAAVLAPGAVERAEAAWAQGRYEDAATAYAEAYAEQGDIAFLYARAQAEQRSGDCTAATQTYESFIATQPKPEWADAARAEMQKCRAIVDAHAAARSEPEPAPAEPGPEPPAQDQQPSPPSRPWHRDPTAIALLAGGGATAVVGAALLGTAHATQNDAESADDIIEYGTHNDRAFVMSRVGIGVLALGGALVVGGVIRYAVLARRRSESSDRRRAAVPLLWSMRF
jgi:hypothetical protein